VAVHCAQLLYIFLGLGSRLVLILFILTFDCIYKFLLYSGDVTTVLSYEFIETKQFLPRDAVHSALLAVVRYVCLSVRPSVTLVYCIETTEDIV